MTNEQIDEVIAMLNNLKTKPKSYAVGSVFQCCGEYYLMCSAAYGNNRQTVIFANLNTGLRLHDPIECDLLNWQMTYDKIEKHFSGYGKPFYVGPASEVIGLGV